MVMNVLEYVCHVIHLSNDEPPLAQNCPSLLFFSPPEAMGNPYASGREKHAFCPFCPLCPCACGCLCACLCLCPCRCGACAAPHLCPCYDMMTMMMMVAGTLHLQFLWQRMFWFAPSAGHRIRFHSQLFHFPFPSVYMPAIERRDKYI